MGNFQSTAAPSASSAAPSVASTASVASATSTTAVPSAPVKVSAAPAAPAAPTAVATAATPTAVATAAAPMAPANPANQGPSATATFDDVRFVVEKVDVDGIDDGDLIKEFKGDKLISQRFVSKPKIEEIAKKTLEVETNAKNERGTSGKKEQIVYERGPLVPENKPVIVQDQSVLSYFLKAGAGYTLGPLGVQKLYVAISSLFSFDGGKGGRKARRAKSKV